MLFIVQSTMFQLVSLSQSTNTLNVTLSYSTPNNGVDFSWQLASLVALTTFAVITLYKKDAQGMTKPGFAASKT